MKIAFNPSTVAALTTPPNNKDITFDLRGRNIFARGVKFYGTDTNTWRDIKINNVSIGSYTLDLRNGSNTTLTNTNGVVTINSTWRPVVDNLTSDSTTSSLSAKQGKVLKALIDGKSNSDHNHDGRYVRYYAVTTLDCNNLAAGLTAARISATNAAHTNHSAYLYISDVGTPFQIQIPDSSIPYIYKRYYGSGKWSGWFKLNAGYADSAGSVAWANVTGKPSAFNPAAHTHTVFKNNLMIKGTNGISDSASIHLGIGDSDTGFKWISDGVCQIYANNAAVGQWTSGGMNWFKNPTVNGNKVWNAGNDGSGSGLDADTLDGYHAASFVKMYTGRFNQYHEGTWTKILQFTIPSGHLQPTISFIWHPTECARDVWADFNINIRSGSPIFYVNWKGTTRRTVYCVGDGTTYSVWVQGTKSSWDPFGLVQVISTLSINTYQAGSLQYSDSEPTGTYKVVASMSGIIMYADRLLTARKINGTSFDGTSDITTAYWGTTRTISLTGAITGSVSTNGGGNITINTTYGTGNITNLDNRYVKKAGDTMQGNLTFTSGKQTRWTAHGTSYITDGNVNSGTSLGGNLANLVISSWYGVSFTTSCSGQTYTNKTAVGINCRTGIVYAANFVGPLQGNAASATNADMVDGYHENSFLRYRGATYTDQEATLWSQIGIKQYINALPDNLTGVYNYGSVISLPGFNSRFEIYASHYSNGNGLYYRSGWDNDKKAWLKFIDSSNIGSQSVNYANSAGHANSAGNADTLGGMPKNYGRAPFGTIPSIGNDGVMEIGRYIDFHSDNSGSYDYSTRIQATGNYKNIVNLPSASGTLALTSYGGDDSTPIFLGYLNLYNGNDGTISSSFPCLGYSVPFTYTRGGAYCLINIPNTSFQTFYIKAAIASVHYSGAGMGHWVGNHRGDGAWWLHCDAVGSNAVQVKGFHLANENNDSWWGGNPLYSGDGAAKIITVCLFGHVKYK